MHGFRATDVTNNPLRGASDLCGAPALETIAVAATAVSVVIPAYNNAATLPRTIDSLQAQSRSDWEAIIACDGPVDGTLECAALEADRDPRITVIALDHHGVAQARNEAIMRSSSPWLLFLDADDTIGPSFLNHMLGVAQRNPAADVIACGYFRRNENGAISARFRPLPLDRDALAVCAAGPPGAIHSFLVRRSLVVEHGGFDTSLRTNEDWDLWLRLAQSGARFAVTRSLLADYWSTPNSLSRRGTQMLHDAGIVQLRAQAVARAPRPGLEQFDQRPYSLDDLTLRNAFWNAGVAIGQRRPVADLIADISPDADYRYQQSQLALKLFDGLVVGSGISYADMATRWSALADDVAAFFSGLQRRCGASTLDPLARTLEIEVARAGRFDGEIELGKVLAVSLTVWMLMAGYRPSSTADVVIFRAKAFRPATMFSFAAPLVGALTGRDVRAVIRRGISRRLETHLRRHARRWRALSRLRRLRALMRRVIGRTGPPSPKLSAAVRRITEIETTWQLSQRDRSTHRVDDPPLLHPGAQSSAAEWDAFFASEDPWDYGSEYEQEKYRRTLSLIEPIPHGKALEIACAEGRFTATLATVAGRVHAVDISPRAIERARRRTAAFDNVTFEARDLFSQGVAGEWDVITCSEMLYFVPSVAALQAVGRQIAAALRPGGQFVHAHAYELHESRDRTAFDWEDTVGAQTIFETFRDTPGLAHIRTIETDLYRIDLFRRAPAGATSEIERCGLGSPLPAQVAASVVWNGAIETRAEAAARRCYELPVLFYNGVLPREEAHDLYTVAPDTIEHQLRFLRRRGFRSVTSEEWLEGAARAGSLRGRPVMITFDGWPDRFEDLVWPIICGNGFAAHLFLAAEDLDPDRGGIDPARARKLLDRGVTYGSRLMTATPADRLASRDLLEEAARSRQLLGDLLGVEIQTIAPPAGFSDIAIEWLMSSTGYRRSFVLDGGRAPVCGFEMRTPRIEITEEITIDQFAKWVAPGTAGPDQGDMP